MGKLSFHYMCIVLSGYRKLVKRIPNEKGLFKHPNGLELEKTDPGIRQIRENINWIYIFVCSLFSIVQPHVNVDADRVNTNYFKKSLEIHKNLIS